MPARSCRRRPAMMTAVEAATESIDVRTTYARATIETDCSRPAGRMLYLDDIECSYVDLDDPTHLEFGYVKRFADVIELTTDPTELLRVTHLGGGGLTLPRYLAATRRGETRQLVYELDDALLDLVRRELGARTSARLRVKLGDARARLQRRSQDSADVIVGDAFHGRVVPAHLLSAEFVGLVRRVLRPGGVYLLNLIDGPPLRLARSHAATLLQAFNDVVIATDPDVLRGKSSGNLVFAASDARLPVDRLRTRAAVGRSPDRVLDYAGVLALAGDAKPLHDPD